ncbi:hypothetical protein [Nocardia amikacinitolerans]|uniref:hypothetical protein n=1 Tax=Nocardia amikacinitolerans TaxID=756689 RepID=UPI0020A35567|nr:hypothetical protein [Nocardia amikacinitolerans]MCP2278373.1 hypothetical protein [Nocardia amikacinitolerans]MCP2299060.1 hypothetical protein [Nocardia amikacinitolerans]
MSPQIPGMPMPLPPTDPGQGAHGSQPWYSRADDYAFAETVTVAIGVADGLGWTHAAAHLKHYLENTGKDLTLDPDQIMNEDPTLKQKADKVVTDYVRYLASDPANHGKTIPFQVPWEADHSFSKSSQADWYYAIGSVHVTASGVATIHTPDAEGAQPRVTVDFQIHLFDRYNWDSETADTEGKGVTIGSIPIDDRRMGALHTAGLAKEFNMLGSSLVKRYEGVIANGSVDSTGPESVRDTRVDPTRTF